MCIKIQLQLSSFSKWSEKNSKSSEKNSGNHFSRTNFYRGPRKTRFQSSRTTLKTSTRAFLMGKMLDFEHFFFISNFFWFFFWNFLIFRFFNEHFLKMLQNFQSIKISTAQLITSAQCSWPEPSSWALFGAWETARKGRGIVIPFRQRYISV